MAFSRCVERCWTRGEAKPAWYSLACDPDAPTKRNYPSSLAHHAIWMRIQLWLCDRPPSWAATQWRQRKTLVQHISKVSLKIQGVQHVTPRKHCRTRSKPRERQHFVMELRSEFCKQCVVLDQPQRLPCSTEQPAEGAVSSLFNVRLRIDITYSDSLSTSKQASSCESFRMFA